MKMNPDWRKKEDWKESRDGFGEGLLILGEKNPKVVVLCADLSKSTRASLFKDRFPERFFQFGVAEQNMMGAAAGMSLAGYIPFVCTYGVFATGRCYDQLRVSVCYSKSNVKIEGAHSGLLVGPDGATHQALEDIALARVLPNLTVIEPCDAIEAKKATLAMAEINGPVYIRLGREKIPVITTEETPFQIGKANLLREGTNATVIACGPEVAEALSAAEMLEKEGIQTEVINLHTIKPIDVETITKSAQKTGAVVTAEIHQIAGGMGSAVAEVLSQNAPVPMEMVGVKDHFGESGKPWELLERFGLSAPFIMEAVKRVIKRKRS